MDFSEHQRVDEQRRLDWAGDYNGEACERCDRLRVMICANGKRVCEKCRWSPDEQTYISERI